MSKVFRAVFLREFMSAWLSEKLSPPPSAPTKKKDIDHWRRARYQQAWVVYAKAPFGGPDSVVEYLGRYTHKTAISNHRLLDVGPEKVSFQYKDYREKGVRKTMALDGVEFLHRFCLHILPPGFRNKRHYGILSNYHKASALAAARISLGVDPDSIPEKKSRAERIRDLLENHLGRSLSDCPDCGAVDSLVRILLPPNARAPPADFVYVAVK
jgi:hypothetical protein